MRFGKTNLIPITGTAYKTIALDYLYNERDKLKDIIEPLYIEQTELILKQRKVLDEMGLSGKMVESSKKLKDKKYYNYLLEELMDKDYELDKMKERVNEIDDELKEPREMYDEISRNIEKLEKED